MNSMVLTMRHRVTIKHSKLSYVLSPHGRNSMSVRSQLLVLAGVGGVLLQLESCDRGKY